MTLPPPRPVTEADLLAYVDGRLDPGRRFAVEAHLAHCPEDAARIAADLAILEGLRQLFDPEERRRRRAAGPWLTEPIS